ncbi:hypothetical protein [Pseudomonas phage PPAY]|nr:hypothetical protein [Pseudomonas phage PPAY]UCW44431.1 hypothetical protein [Pseudomonas phage PPAT]
MGLSKTEISVLEDGTIYVPWRYHLSSLYNIAGAGGATDPEAVKGEFLDYLRAEYGRYVTIELEGIPEGKEDSFDAYVFKGL